MKKLTTVLLLLLSLNCYSQIGEQKLATPPPYAINNSNNKNDGTKDNGNGNQNGNGNGGNGHHYGWENGRAAPLDNKIIIPLLGIAMIALVFCKKQK